MRTSFTSVVASFVVIAAFSSQAMASTAAAVPVYPGAVASARPAGVGLGAPPPSAKTYVTSDNFAKVKAWYRAHLKGAQELAQPGMEKTEDAFLVGRAKSGLVIMVQSYQGKTWIIVGPPK